MKNYTEISCIFLQYSHSVSKGLPEGKNDMENHPYGRILHIKYLVLKSSLTILLFVHFWFQYSQNALNYKKSIEIFKMCFYDISKIVARKF